MSFDIGYSSYPSFLSLFLKILSHRFDWFEVTILGRLLREFVSFTFTVTFNTAAPCPSASVNYDCYEPSLTCSTTLTNITIRITISKTVGATYNNMDNSFWAGVLNQSHSDNGTHIIYRWTINNSQTVSCPSSYVIGARFDLFGTAQPNSVDTYVVTTRDTNGIITAISGTF